MKKFYNFFGKFRKMYENSLEMFRSVFNENYAIIL